MEADVTSKDPIAGLPKFLRWMVTGERFLGVVLLLMILVLMAAQVVARYVLNAPIPWSEELARLVLIWLAFIAAASVMAQSRHIAVDVISRFLGWRGALALECMVSVVILGVCAAFLPAGVQFIQHLGEVRSPALHIPMSWWYGAALAGFSLLAFHTAVNLVLALKGKAPVWRQSGHRPVEMETGS